MLNFSRSFSSNTRRRSAGVCIRRQARVMSMTRLSLCRWVSTSQRRLACPTSAVTLLHSQYAVGAHHRVLLSAICPHATTSHKLLRCNTACRSELPGCCVFSVCELLWAATNCNRPMPTRLVVALLSHTVILRRVFGADTVLRALLAVLELLAAEARRVYRPLSTLRHGAPHHTHTQHTLPHAWGTELPGMACGARNVRQLTLTPTTHTPQHPPHSPPRRQTVIARRQGGGKCTGPTASGTGKAPGGKARRRERAKGGRER